MQSELSGRFALGTFSIAGCSPFAALVLGNRAIALHALAASCATLDVELSGTESTLALLQHWPHNFHALVRLVDAIDEGNKVCAKLAQQWVDVSGLRVHPPVNLPRQIFCSGANYRKHVIDIIVDTPTPEMASLSAEERRSRAEKLMDDRAAHGAPYMFSKIPSAVSGPYDPIVLPGYARQPDWELELAVVIGKAARHVHLEHAMDYVAGYTIANDISSRDLIFRSDVKAMGTDWVASKNAPTFFPMGPYIVPAAFVPEPHNLQLTLKLNGQTMQNERTNDMIFDIARQIEYVSSLVQLWPGDILSTGSPAGNGTHYNRYLQPGDVLETAITGLGTQRNVCHGDESRPAMS
jgi:2-keto-4-pentenoate hydratase/2-oxohepta-3-ene-1,7-dioic acid hydratase in catechol pathway